MVTVTGPSFELIRDAFISVSGHSVGNGVWTTFLCPAHEDDQPSAAIKYDPHQHRTVVRCFAGCPDTLVLETLGLNIGDLFDRPPSGTSRHTTTLGGDRDRARTSTPAVRRKRRSLGKQLGWPIEVAQYLYRDVHGARIGRVIRTRTEYEYGTKKGFYLRRFEPSTGTWPLGAFEPVLYRLPQVAEAIGAGRAIWVCEGEKDVDRAAAVGLAATCNALGAGSFTPVHAQQLHGASRVVIVADRDPAGYAHARTVRNLLRLLVDQVGIVQARDGKDLSDHLDAGHGLEDFEPCIELGYGEVNLSDLIEVPLDPTADPEQRQLGDARFERILACARPPFSRPTTPMSTDLAVRGWSARSVLGQGVSNGPGVEP